MIGTMKIRFKKLSPDAKTPTRGSENAAAYDLTATKVEHELINGAIVYTIHTGLAVEIPKGCFGDVRPRSSVYKTAALLSNGCGVIDSDYRGEIMGKFYLIGNDGGAMYETGERCLQLIISPMVEVEWTEAETLTTTERGDGGYGSTGK